MKTSLLRFRVWLANQLVRLATRIRPRSLNQFMQSLEDQMIFGTGITRINPKDMFKD